MLKIDENLLQELGLNNLNDAEKNDAIEAITNALKDRIGNRAIDALNDQQVEKLENEMLNRTFQTTQTLL